MAAAGATPDSVDTPRMQLLSDNYGKRPSRWPSFGASVLLHVVGIASLPWLGSLFDHSAEPVAVAVASIEPLQIQIPESLYVARGRPGAGGGGAKKAGETEGGSSGSAGGRAGGPGEAGEAGRGIPKPGKGDGDRPAPRAFELPDLPKRAKAPQTILQPQFPPDMPLQADIRLPEILLWASAPKLPPPPTRKFVAPGNPKPVKQPVVFDAPPKLQMPNDVLQTADLKLADSPLLSAPKLPVPPANVAPLRTFVAPEREAPKPTAILDQFVGEPTNLLALSINPAPLTESILVPGGNQLGELPGPPPEPYEAPTAIAAAGRGGVGGTGTEPGSPTGVPGGSGLAGNGGSGGLGAGGPGPGGAGGGAGRGFGASGTGIGAGGGEGAGAGGGIGPGFGSGGSGAGFGTGSGTGAGVGAGIGAGSGYGAGSGPGSGGTGTGAGGGHGPGYGSGSGPGYGGAGGVLSLPAPGAGLPSSMETRIEHPMNAVFDVVVIGSSPMDGLPESAGILSGKPVFTVYLKVGTPKEWMLQYCVPNQSHEPRIAGAVVTIGNPAPLYAPFPRVTVLPPASLLPVDRRVSIHGFVDDTGHFRDLRVLGKDTGEFEANLIPFLERWIFRPAIRDGVPILVEILLVVPSLQA